MEGLDAAVWQSKCNTFSEEGGGAGDTDGFLNRQEGDADRCIANSPMANDTPWPT